MFLKDKRERVLQFKQVYLEHHALRAVRQRSVDEENRLTSLRSEINRSTPIVIGIINDVGEPTSIHYAPPPMVGGMAGRFDLLQNIFNPALIGIHQNVLDMLDRGIGRYDFLIQNQWKKWVNPFHWIGEIIRLPFHLLRFAGFNSSKVELSTVGKVYKLVIGFVAFLAGMIKIYTFVKPFLEARGIHPP